jgi:hypothetical protein
MQLVISTHLSQSTGIGALVGQHGMSLAMSSAAGMSSAIAAIDESEAVPAMTGRGNGPSTSPAIVRIASSRRMVFW